MMTILLITHFIGLAMGLGTSITMRLIMPFIMTTTDRNADALAKKANINSMIGIILLLVSGVGMVVLNSGFVDAGGLWFKLKLALVVVLLIDLGLIKKNSIAYGKSKDLADLKKNAPLGLIGLSTTTLIVIFAVLAFH